MAHVTPCPQCGKDLVWTPEARWRPFCSKRCQLIDLGEWLQEEHRIPGPEPNDGPFAAPDSTDED